MITTGILLSLLGGGNSPPMSLCPSSVEGPRIDPRKGTCLGGLLRQPASEGSAIAEMILAEERMNCRRFIGISLKNLLGHFVPFRLIVLDQDLIVQPVDLNIDGFHIPGKMKKARGGFRSQEFEG